MPRTIFMGGRPIPVGENATQNDIRRAGNVDRDHFMAIQNPEGTGYQIFDERSTLPKGKEDLHLVSLPRFRKGFDDRKQRILDEVKIISYRYPVEVDLNNLKYIAVREFPLNRYFSQSTTTILIKIPIMYPETPPVHFFMKKTLKYKGGNIPHFYDQKERNELADRGWGKFCVHIDQNWKPSVNLLEGDNLLTYLELIKTLFDNPDKESV
jgi:hypothetical protein